MIGTNTNKTLAAITALLLLFLACVKPPACRNVSATGQRKTISQTRTVIITVGNSTGDLNGQTRDSIFITGTDPQTRQLFYTGSHRFTAANGTFTCRVIGGTLDLVTGEYNHYAQIVSGTGFYDLASGTLSVHGFNSEELFTDDSVSGDICTGKPSYIR